MTLKHDWNPQIPLCRLVKATSRKQMRPPLSIKIALVLCAAALLILTACAETPAVSRLNAPPDLLASCPDDFLSLMETALQDAEGLDEAWLYQYAGEAEECRLRLNGLQVWAQ